jgi:chromate transporter
MAEIFELFFIFAKMGAVTFGGGYAMLPILQREIVDKRGWATENELLDYYAIGQCTPGIIAVNVATFIGYKRKKLLGGIFATLGIIFPSVVIITIIAAFIQNFADYAVVKYAFCGIRVCVCVLIFNAVTKLWKKAIADKFALLIFIAVLIISTFTNIAVTLLVVLAGIVGAAFKAVCERRGKEK